MYVINLLKLSRRRGRVPGPRLAASAPHLSRQEGRDMRVGPEAGQDPPHLQSPRDSHQNYLPR